ncbi:MAG: helix-turn-helix domain-containing protein [Clostridia bacterium]|nr:helix-turn-helix domain-containing protein [Clostridia bacterium]
MEKKTIGKFMSALRKANGMTQKELGERLFVSDKTVSRWECDESTPELSLIPSIAEIFGITTDELLRGERNNPDREVASEDATTKQKAKSDKQFKLMLHSRKKRFTNLSLISIGLIIVGLIAAMICNLGFSKGLLGFCLASVFFVAATICQICFTVSFRLLIDEEEAEHAKEIKKANTDMVFSSVKIFFGILLTFAFCLPIAVLTLAYFNSHYGLVIDSWILFGSLFAAVAFLLAFCVYKIFVLKTLIKKEIVWLDEQTVGKANAESNLLGKICIVFTVVLAIIMLATYIITSSVSESTFIERERFNDPDKFIEYMQNGYDTWYEEGYGDLPAPPHNELGYPNRKWAEIDGKEYYYCAHLYESIDILQHLNGEWEIIVTTDEADQNGQAMYSILNAGLLSLHVINLAVCVVWYLVKTKKRKTA